MAMSFEDTLGMYLSQYLKTASNERIVLVSKRTIGTKPFYIFKCKSCGDNWHVGEENFVNGTSVPQVLIDWVLKHRHVCYKYTNTRGVSYGNCSLCGWPYQEHDPILYTRYYDAKPTPAPTPAREKPLPIFKGRKFRDTEPDIEMETP